MLTPWLRCYLPQKTNCGSSRDWKFAPGTSAARIVTRIPLFFLPHAYCVANGKKLSALEGCKVTSQRGFTLLELMIAVAVIAILASLAYPSYLDSVRKSRRADGMAALMNVQLAQQKLRSNCRFFAGSLTTGEVCGASADASSIRSLGIPA